MDPNQFNCCEKNPLNEEVDTQFSTQIELENITIEEGGESSTRKKNGTRIFFSIKKDKLLISSWFNVSLDLIVGDEDYNTYRGNLSERSNNQLKFGWQNIHYVKSGYTKNDVMINAYIIWKDDEEKDFTLEHAWKLLKDQHKWLEQCKENYSSSSNQETLINVSESYTPTPLACPTGQKVTKRKAKVKRASSSTPVVDLSGIEKQIKERNMYDILMNDTSNMTQDQHKKHKITYKHVLKKFSS
ncbi:hypothetical protein GLYMA_09G140900v4 [Glycine max]|uniref:No apical meristem-associated C-terminal domain-containing protein n=2 Tax=Glycine subgen. Soja TaxID=1462606 RepID=A0A0R0I899_SOYBN|nr:hypothetical protein JHK85_025722 [Glycine max]KRH38506.1 hypothetical protein GLYMA_09G140900v4 [Glycine max]RZB92004.1 hypothetical protein D0Y65_024145 [Glycine soja]